MAIASIHELWPILLKCSELWSFFLEHEENRAWNMLIYSISSTWMVLPIYRRYKHEFNQLQLKTVKTICILQQ